MKPEISPEIKQQWANPRRFAGLEFAGKNKLKKFPHGKDLTNSARSTFMNCRRKYEYQYVLGLAPRRTSIPFLVGGLFHAGLDRAYSNGFRMDLDQEKKLADDACEKVCSIEGMTPEESDKIWSQSSVVLGMLSGYAKQWLPQDSKNWEVIEAEGAFDVELPKGWRYRGKTDLVVRDRKTKRIKLVEHKTTSRIDAGYVAKLPLDNQILGYIWAKNKEKLDICEVVYNVVKKPSIRLKQNESQQAFEKRLIDEYTINAPAYFYREALAFSPADVDRYAAELFKFLGEIISCEEKDYYYQNTTQCTTMGVCPFIPLCTGGLNDKTLPMYRIKEKAHEELPEAE